MDFLIALAEDWGIFTGIVGLVFWYFKRHVDKVDAERKEREKSTEELMLLMLRSCRSTNVLAMATAKAVQRIPDAHCNGDMTKAIEEATKLQGEEKDFLFDQGIKHIFGDS